MSVSSRLGLEKEGRGSRFAEALIRWARCNCPNPRRYFDPILYVGKSLLRYQALRNPETWPGACERRARGHYRDDQDLAIVRSWSNIRNPSIPWLQKHVPINGIIKVFRPILGVPVSCGHFPEDIQSLPGLSPSSKDRGRLFDGRRINRYTDSDRESKVNVHDVYNEEWLCMWKKWMSTYQSNVESYLGKMVFGFRVNISLVKMNTCNVNCAMVHLAAVRVMASVFMRTHWQS